MSSEPTENGPTTTSMRVDKWLWAARIFKTRPVASAEVTGGKVHVNGNRVKPAHPVRRGDTLTIHRRYDELTVRVEALSNRRGPAPIAATLYTETEESRTARAQRAATRAALPGSSPHPDSRPTKKQRRALTRLRDRRSF